MLPLPHWKCCPCYSGLFLKKITEVCVLRVNETKNTTGNAFSRGHLGTEGKIESCNNKKNKILTFFYDNQEYKITTTKKNNNVNFYLLYLSVETKSSVEHIQFTMYWW